MSSRIRGVLIEILPNDPAEVAVINLTPFHVYVFAKGYFGQKSGFAGYLDQFFNCFLAQKINQRVARGPCII